MSKPIHQPLGEGLRIMIWLTLCFCCARLAAQPCPSLINCPQSTLTYCDESTNQISLWNYPPFTYSQTIGNADLHEGPIDLNLKVKGCNGGGLTYISFLLFLDLDNDDLQETVLKSNNLPPAGRVFANNSFNPGYSGGDTVWFDQRALPDSLLYRFTFEIAYSGDTTTAWIRFCSDADPYNYSQVQLPEGRHRIEWHIVQDGVDRYCDRNFKVKDCKKPTVACKSGLGVYLDINQSASLTLAQALQSVSDNVTPDSQLVVGMRRAGAGSGFPFDVNGDPQDTVMFSCLNDANEAIEIWAKDRAGNLENCTAAVLIYDTSGVCSFTPPPAICARTYWNNETIRGVSFRTFWSTPNQPDSSHPLEVNFSGCSELTTLPPTNVFTLSAAKDTVPLNGVTTFDLVLISKHILALQPFDAGWKIVAADANQSNSVTTFDIVELRKLILGLTNKLPNNVPSWRFYVDSCTAWGNPFFGNCPGSYTLPVQAISAYPPQLSFKGIKMGDVNGTAASIDTLQGMAESRGDACRLELPDITLQKGEILNIPLRAAEGGAWEGLQFAIKFDPELLEIVGVSPDENLKLSPENWSVFQSGVLNMSWSDAYPTTILPGDILLNLRVKSRSELRLSEVLKCSNDIRLKPEVYDAAGIIHPVQLTFSQKSKTTESGASQIFAPVPNPTTGFAQLSLRLNTPENVLLEISDLSGKLLWTSVSPLSSGAHILDIPESVLRRSGVYVWRVCAGNVVQSGKLVRL